MSNELLDLAMAIAHERELDVTGHKHDTEGAIRRFNAACQRMGEPVALGGQPFRAQPAEPVELPVIEPNDLRIDTYRAEPHSAWIVKSDTGVRVTHVPTGLSAACHEDRSVHRNRALAMEKLQKMLQTHEPVKVPSDLDILDVWQEFRDFHPDWICKFARALLARYGNQENSNG